MVHKNFRCFISGNTTFVFSRILYLGFALEVLISYSCSEQKKTYSRCFSNPVEPQYFQKVFLWFPNAFEGAETLYALTVVSAKK